MCCEQIERQLGRYLDRELSEVDRDRVKAHLAACGGCRSALDELRDVVNGIAQPGVVRVPDSLWANIARRLDPTERADSSTAPPAHRSLRPGARWAIAACLALAMGLGLFGLSSLDTTARASSVDFGVLLDALPLDAHKAFRKFIVRYDGKPTTPVAAKRLAPGLNFDTPVTLPGGFRLMSVYQLRIGETRGIAAVYDRDGEFLAAVFHQPMAHENFGSHENFPCVIGEHCGHKVRVGEWTLVHLTDSTTCHCLLSRLDEETEIPAVMNAIAPRLAEAQPGETHTHP